MKLSIILSVYNESEGLNQFWDQLRSKISAIPNHSFQLIWVNDGSTDNSQDILSNIKLNNTQENIEHTIIEFSMNFGHEAAIIAGIDETNSEAIICMDSDGQHPPSKILELVNAYEEGYEIVLMKRSSREDHNFFGRMFSSIFYSFINSISTISFEKNSSDFFLINQKVAQVLKTNFREKKRFIRGFIQSIGFNKLTLTYQAPSRIAGNSNYSFIKLSKLAFDAVFLFSNKPLRISILFSTIFILFTVLFSIYTLYIFLFGENPPSGYTSVILLISLSFSFLFINLTVLSLYFEKSINEMRSSPIYIIKNKH